jgi:hypothetical protein
MSINNTYVSYKVCINPGRILYLLYIRLEGRKRVMLRSLRVNLTLLHNFLILLLRFIIKKFSP